MIFIGYIFSRISKKRELRENMHSAKISTVIVLSNCMGTYYSSKSKTYTCIIEAFTPPLKTFDVPIQYKYRYVSLYLDDTLAFILSIPAYDPTTLVDDGTSSAQPKGCHLIQWHERLSDQILNSLGHTLVVYRDLIARIWRFENYSCVVEFRSDNKCIENIWLIIDFYERPYSTFFIISLVNHYNNCLRVTGYAILTCRKNTGGRMGNQYSIFLFNLFVFDM